MSIKTLNSLLPGETAIVDQFTAELPLQARLVEMGILPGVELRLVKKAPFNGPLEFKIRGYHILLRCKDASQILVQG